MKEQSYIEMTQAEWDAIPNDFKVINCGARFVLVCRDDIGTTFAYVIITK